MMSDMTSGNRVYAAVAVTAFTINTMVIAALTVIEFAKTNNACDPNFVESNSNSNSNSTNTTAQLDSYSYSCTYSCTYS